MEPGDQGESSPDLVSLQVTDHVPLHSPPLQLACFFPKLLGTVLPQLVTTCRQQLTRHLCADVLADAHKYNLVTTTTAACCRLVDTLADGLQVGCH